MKDPFLESSHFWPLDNHKSILSIDIQTGHNAILMNGSTISVDPSSKLVYASTEYPGSYIILGDFNGKIDRFKTVIIKSEHKGVLNRNMK